MGLAGHGLADDKIHPYASAHPPDALAAQGLGKHREVGGIDLRVEATLKGDVALQRVLPHRATGKHGRVVIVVGAQQVKGRHAADEFHRRG